MGRRGYEISEKQQVIARRTDTYALHARRVAIQREDFEAGEQFGRSLVKLQ